MNPHYFSEEELKLLRIDLYTAYYDCRRHKRGTCNALQFELNLEQEVERLYNEIVLGNYNIGRSTAFIVYEPVQREIFAANFRDRVVHHYLINKLEPIFERVFIYDSYSCRKGKGTHFGVKRVSKFIRSCSQNYTKDCYILKVDIQGFFMNIDKAMLNRKLAQLIEKHYQGFDKSLILDLVNNLVRYNPVPNCVIKGSRKDWEGLPDSKSLFRTQGEVGILIGNLTSQIFANFYLNDFDQYVKRSLKMKYYGRYVDDMVLVSTNKEELKAVAKHIGNYLNKELSLNLHPRKTYLQHYTKGVEFLGIIIKPYRLCVGKRIQKNINRTFTQDYKQVFDDNEVKHEQKINHWLSSANSYLGMCKHYNNYRLRQKMCNKLLDSPLGLDVEGYRMVSFAEGR